MLFMVLTSHSEAFEITEQWALGVDTQIFTGWMDKRFREVLKQFLTEEGSSGGLREGDGRSDSEV